MPIKRVISQSRCKCSKPEIYLQTDYPFDLGHLQLLKTFGYQESPQYSNRGILMMYDADLIIRGSFGSNRLKITYKKPNCSESLDRLEAILEELNADKIQGSPEKTEKH